MTHAQFEPDLGCPGFLRADRYRHGRKEPTHRWRCSVCYQVFTRPRWGGPVSVSHSVPAELVVERILKAKGLFDMMLLPPPADTCPICAVTHDVSDPHDSSSIYYQYRFYGLRGRWATWADAIAHCTPEIQRLWKSELQIKGHWSQPKEGDPIADQPTLLRNGKE